MSNLTPLLFYVTINGGRINVRFCFIGLCNNDGLLSDPLVDVKMSYPELFGILFVIGVCLLVGVGGLLYILFGKDK